MGFQLVVQKNQQDRQGKITADGGISKKRNNNCSIAVFATLYLFYPPGVPNDHYQPNFVVLEHLDPDL